MSREIKSYTELKAHIGRLTIERELKELKIRESVQKLSEQLRPANLIKSAFSSVSSDSELRSGFAVKGIETALSFLLTNVVLRKAGPFMKTIATLAGTTMLSQIIGDEGGKYLDKIKSFISRFRKNGDGSDMHEFDEKKIYRNE